MSFPLEDRPEALREHTDWLRAFARRLAGVQEADDLVQDAWVAVLERSPAAAAPRGSLRGFLAGVLRNQGRMARRGATRRREHEERRAEEAPRAPLSGEAAVERAELARAVMACVLELEEPFKAAVLLRYGEGVSAPEAARTLGVPVKTVESRARRGLARLRERWERTHGADRPGWIEALAVVAAPAGLPPSAVSPASPDLTPPAAEAAVAGSATLGAPAATTLTLAAAMQTKLLAAVLLIAGCAGAFWLAQDRGGRAVARTDAAEEQEPPAQLASPGQELQSVSAAEAEPMEREVLPRLARTAQTAAAPQAAPPETPALRRIRGRVFDVHARPLAGIAVVLHGPGESERAGVQSPPLARAVSAVDGSFELGAPTGRSLIRADADGLVTLVAGSVDGADDVEVPLVVAQHRPLSGYVLDEERVAKKDLTVTLQPPAGFYARFDATFDATVTETATTRTDELGGFTLDAAPVIPGSTLVTRMDGYLPASLPAPPGPTAGLELVLRRPEDIDALRGRVTDAMGAPAGGAWVTLGGTSAVCDDGGWFFLPREGGEDATELRALKRGHAPGALTVERDPASGKPAWPEWIEVSLGSEPLRLAGRVVDGQGAARADVQVWIEDPSPFGVLGEDEMLTSTEFLLAHGATPEHVDDAYWWSTTTDAAGAFEVPGLLDREYRLRLFDRARRETAVAGPFAAGRGDVVVEFPREALSQLRGRTLAGDGTPLQGLDVELMCRAYGGTWSYGGSAVTDDEGRFAFDDVGNVVVSLHIKGEDVLPHWTQLDGDARGRENDVILQRLRHLKVELTDPARANGYRLFDAEGQTVLAHRIGATGRTSKRRVEVLDGTSRTMAVGENAATLVLLQGDEEVARIPLQLHDGAINTVTL